MNICSLINYIQSWTKGGELLHNTGSEHWETVTPEHSVPKVSEALSI